MGSDAVVLPVEGSRQVDSRCGPNALAMLLRSAGDSITEPEIAAAIFDTKADATLSVDLLLYARQRGFPADFSRGSADALISLLKVGRPAILLLNLQAGGPVVLKGLSMWHYVVVFGYDPRRREFLLHSGIGPKTMGSERLERLWKPGGFWMMDLGIPGRLSRPSEGILR
jgi:ABC-type bacteriocin/lantibiotic exporter with double-glycine peptidase domain